jgi:hypothetical protein
MQMGVQMGVRDGVMSVGSGSGVGLVMVTGDWIGVWLRSWRLYVWSTRDSSGSYKKRLVCTITVIPGAMKHCVVPL